MKQADALYALLLSPALPQEVVAWLVGYLYQTPQDHFLICSEVAVQGPFLHLVILRNDDSNDGDDHWKIRLPIQYALMIADLSDKEALPVGFLKN